MINPTVMLQFLLLASSLQFQAGSALSPHHQILRSNHMPQASSCLHMRPWYSDPEIGRDRSHVIKEEAMREALVQESSRFILMSKHGMAHKSIPSMDDQHEPRIEPLYLSGDDIHIALSQLDMSLDDMIAAEDSSTLLAWVGSYQEHDYWVVRVPALEELSLGEWKPLREFGDRLERSVDAGILATANGLVEFHKSHGFCSACGVSTIASKAGASRKCNGCNRSIYPRMDVAAIMLITSPCGNYALLGRKENWPQGRYSTLSGFAEVGETLEECCMRETFEEGGVVVDPSSVSFVASQPWPFPRSLMVGFQGRAKYAGEGLPTINVDEEEMEDVQWFSRDYVRERVAGGSTAMGYQPTAEEAEFHIPGRSSLARVLITKWVESE